MPRLTDRIKTAVGNYFLAALETRAAAPGISGGMPGWNPTVDAFRRRQQPTKRALMDVMRGFVYACSSKNANGVAQVPLRLYVRTNKGDTAVKSSRFPVDVDPKRREFLRWGASPSVQKFVSRSDKLEEITSHPILTMLQSVNPFMNQFDLIRMTTMELDTTGEAYWLPKNTNAGSPGQIWPLESWRMRIMPSLDDDEVVQGFEYMGAKGSRNYRTDELIQFRMVSPHDPYGTGYSPTRAAFEYIELANELLAYETAVVNNRARPDLLISPRDVVSRAMAKRMETRFLEKFRRGGAGGVLVAEAGYDYTPFSWTPQNMGGMDMRRACEEVIAACFDVPLSIVRVEDVNRANAEAGKYAHADLAIRPRCIMIEQKLNEKLTPLYDQRLILAFDNPVPEDGDRDRNERIANLQNGVTSINRERRKIGEPDVPGGDEPLVDPTKVPLSMLAQFVQANLKNVSQQAERMQQQGQFMRPSPTSKAVRRYVAKHFGPMIDQLVRKRAEEERLADSDQAASIWPDIPFQNSKE